MRRAWRRFRAMADADRARMLAIISASAIIGLLYGLGGLSLYLRANFLQETPTAAPMFGLTELPQSEEDEAPALHPTLTPTAPPPGQEGGAAPTLYPTLTPRPDA